jgi:hypothetical protein
VIRTFSSRASAKSMRALPETGFGAMPVRPLSSTARTASALTGPNVARVPSVSSAIRR